MPLLTSGFLAFVLPAAGALAPTPAITQIRANYAAVNAQIEAGHYRRQHRDSQGCGDSTGSYDRWLDRNGKTRRLRSEVTFEDTPGGMTALTSVWFDAAGRPDFVLYQNTEYKYDIQVNKDGSITDRGVKSRAQTAEMRVYFDDQGRVIRQLNKFPMTKQEAGALLQEFRTLIGTPWAQLRVGC
ncbi:hypothetical protein [Deinococcus radiodurans]|jgi:hypothetical protein|nr:hypothetical protein [Deinococcus radiodurans]ANC71525.1 hypothetical protein A2G07_06925 [Deinococcus radiodurans R1 = ATCC 13939 = DSM 20539]QIP29363.1 hypothetical protein HAV23_09530 [Deinococcus radiodurans]QIP31941.1 hypothetical protein HAV35_07270 [Deinococcus radiodurans]UID70307.1 hypothetical protein DRO_1310 [Deinococcus radiodurans R1 = ATCC 13939 = DSM 20539]UTA50799.1 hypothetical protein MSS93_14355 [Deinococcus radiodurans]